MDRSKNQYSLSQTKLKTRKFEICLKIDLNESIQIYMNSKVHVDIDYIGSIRLTRNQLSCLVRTQRSLEFESTLEPDTSCIHSKACPKPISDPSTHSWHVLFGSSNNGTTFSASRRAPSQPLGFFKPPTVILFSPA